MMLTKRTCRGLGLALLACAYALPATATDEKDDHPPHKPPMVKHHPLPAPHAHPHPGKFPMACVPPDASLAAHVCHPQVAYTEEGLRTFLAIFQAAAAQGVENAAVRALNQIHVPPVAKEPPGHDKARPPAKDDDKKARGKDKDDDDDGDDDDGDHDDDDHDHKHHNDKGNDKGDDEDDGPSPSDKKDGGCE